MNNDNFWQAEQAQLKKAKHFARVSAKGFGEGFVFLRFALLSLLSVLKNSCIRFFRYRFAVKVSLPQK